MLNTINEQLNLVLEDLEIMTDPYQRAMVRTNLIAALSNMCPLDASEELEGKEAIKADKPKKESKKKSSSKKKETKTEDAPIEFEKVEAPAPAEPTVIDIDPNTEEEAVLEPVIIQVQDEEGNESELDITEAWYAVSPSMLEKGIEEEVILGLAQNLTLYNLMPIYSTFADLEDCENKMMLSYYLQEVGLDDINDFIKDLSEGQMSDIYAFVNNDNLEFVVNSIAEAMEE